VQRLPDLAPGESARCPPCNKELWRRCEDSLNRTLALTLAAAILYVIANSVPMLGLTIVGRGASAAVIGGAQHLWENGQVIVGVLVLFTAVIAPAFPATSNSTACASSWEMPARVVQGTAT